MFTMKKWLLALIATAAAAPAPPPQTPNPVKIIKVVPNGSGCPDRSVEYGISGDGTLMTMTYSAFQATIGPDRKFDFRKNCQLMLNLEYPSGYQIALTEVYSRSYLKLDANVTAKEVVTSYFSGQGDETTSVAGPFVGPLVKDNFKVTSRFGRLLYSDCRVKPRLNINTVVTLNNDKNPRGDGTIGVESIDANIKSVSLTQVFKVGYQKCP